MEGQSEALNSLAVEASNRSLEASTVQVQAASVASGSLLQKVLAKQSFDETSMLSAGSQTHAAEVELLVVAQSTVADSDAEVEDVVSDVVEAVLHIVEPGALADAVILREHADADVCGALINNNVS